MNNRPASPKGPPKPPPVKPQRPMGEMHASFLKNSSGEEVWSLCANGYDTTNSYSNGKAKAMRIAKPDNWRLDKAAAANDESLRGEEAKKLIESMELEAPQDDEQEGATDLNASMRSTLRSQESTKSSISKKGAVAVFPPGMSSTNDMRPSTRESVASQRSIWKHAPDPETVCTNVPACASGAHRLLRPHTAQVRMSTNLDGTGKWSAPGSKVYKSRPESAALSYAARGLQNATSPIASYVRATPESAKPKPRPGLSNYCTALSAMNREMIRQ